MVAVMGLGVLGFLALTASKPQLKRTKPPVAVAMVRVTKITTGPQAITIRGEGAVRPLREIELMPQVNGKVVFVSPVMVNGGEFNKGWSIRSLRRVWYGIPGQLFQDQCAR
jgi:hypothetical protein